MNLATDATAVTHGIQLAVAPVFFLTAVAGMIGAVAGRLARIIDRARALEVRLRAEGTIQTDANQRTELWHELRWLRKRGILANSSIALLTMCGFLIGLTIITLFVGETTAAQIDRVALVSFMGGVGCFMSALACFMAETLMASHILRFGERKF